jgi:hypothetical protein
MATVIGGFKDKKIESRSKVEPSTTQYIGENRQGLDVVAQVAYLSVGTDAAEAGTTTSVIVATSHVARVGDQIRLTSGTQDGKIAVVQEVAVNAITLSQTLSNAPAPGDTFEILRPHYIKTAADGSVVVSGPITVNQGTNPWTIQGQIKQFDFIGTNAIPGSSTVFPAAFQDLFTNAVVPTGLNASGVIVMGVLPLDLGLNIQTFRNTGECFALSAATANSSATSRYIQVNSSGDVSSDLTRQQPLLFAAINASASGDNTLVAADATRRIKVVSYAFVCSSTVNVTWKSGAGTNLSGAMAFIANTGIAPGTSSPSQGPILQTAVNQALVLNLSGAVQVSGHLSYFLEA